MRYLSWLVLRLCGWKITGSFPVECRRCIVIEAPHTSMWDFFYGWLAFSSLGIRCKFLIKKEIFFFPLGIVLKWLGAIPVDRARSNNMVKYVAHLFHEKESLVVAITPEGTRKRVDNWKKGFYYIALRAKVPIVLGYLDYEKKVGGPGKMLIPTGNYGNDWKIIEEFYRGKKGKHPENFNLS